MKRNFISTISIVALFIFATVLFSCGGSTEIKIDTDSTKVDVTTTTETSTNTDAGKTLYAAKCSSCHGEAGMGIEGTFPPLAKADYLTKETAIAVVLNGLEGEITVNGAKYSMPMAKVALTDTEVVDVCNYILNSFGNSLGTVTEAEVATAKGTE